MHCTSLTLWAFQLVLAILATASADSVSSEIPGVCPGYQEGSEYVVESLLTEDGWSTERNETGIPSTLSADDIVPLRDATDAAACQHFNEHFVSASTKAKYNPAYFKAGQHYFIVFRLKPPPSGELTLGREPLYVLNAEFEVKGIYL